MSRAQSSNISNQAVSNSQTDTSRAGQAYGALYPDLLAQLANPGYTTAQKNAITGATEGGIGAAFGSEAEGAANRAARTNNAAGVGAREDALARQRMITSGNLEAQNQAKFADTALQQRELAQRGLGGLFGQNLTASNQALGTGEAAAAASPSFWDQFGGAFAQALGKGLVPGANLNLRGGSSIGFG